MPLVQAVSDTYGPDSRDRLSETSDPGIPGAEAALESFYHAFNSADLRLIRGVWLDDPLVSLANPLGGVLRGRDDITALYARIFGGPVTPWIRLEDIVVMAPGPTAVVFSGRERGAYGEVELAIRTTRFFAYAEAAGGWRQVHHHGSIDDPAQLRRYQDAVAASHA